MSVSNHLCHLCHCLCHYDIMFLSLIVIICITDSVIICYHVSLLCHHLCHCLCHYDIACVIMSLWYRICVIDCVIIYVTICMWQSLLSPFVSWLCRYLCHYAIICVTVCVCHLCTIDTQGAIEMTWLQVKPEELMEPKVTVVMRDHCYYNNSSWHHYRLILLDHWPRPSPQSTNKT